MSAAHGDKDGAIHGLNLVIQLVQAQESEASRRFIQSGEADFKTFNERMKELSSLKVMLEMMKAHEMKKMYDEKKAESQKWTVHLADDESLSGLSSIPRANTDATHADKRVPPHSSATDSSTLSASRKVSAGLRNMAKASSHQPETSPPASKDPLSLAHIPPGSKSQPDNMMDFPGYQPKLLPPASPPLRLMHPSSDSQPSHMANAPGFQSRSLPPHQSTRISETDVKQKRSGHNAVEAVTLHKASLGKEMQRSNPERQSNDTEQSSTPVAPTNATDRGHGKRLRSPSPRTTVKRRPDRPRESAEFAPHDARSHVREVQGPRELPSTIIEKTDGTAYIEIRCCYCRTNCKQNNDKLPKGASGLGKHILNKHLVPTSHVPSSIWIEQHCSIKEFSAEEIEAIRGGDRNAYQVKVMQAQNLGTNSRYIGREIEPEVEDGNTLLDEAENADGTGSNSHRSHSRAHSPPRHKVSFQDMENEGHMKEDSKPVINSSPVKDLEALRAKVIEKKAADQASALRSHIDNIFDAVLNGNPAPKRFQDSIVDANGDYDVAIAVLYAAIDYSKDSARGKVDFQNVLRSITPRSLGNITDATRQYLAGQRHTNEKKIRTEVSAAKND